MQTAYPLSFSCATNTYDDKGNPLSSTVSSTTNASIGQIITSADYSSDGRHQTSITDSRGNTSTAQYDGKNRLKIATSARGYKTIYTYDDNTDRLLTVSCGGVPINYTYNRNGSLNTIQSPTSLYTFGYDLLERVVSTKVGNKTLATNSYDELGRLEAITYGNGDNVSYRIGSKNEIETIYWNNTPKYSYRYDENGNVAYVSSPHSSYNYSYDLIGRLTSFFGKGNHSGGVKYDSKNRVSSFVSLVDGYGFISEYIYDAKGLLTKVKSTSADNSGKMSSGKMFSKTNAYDALGRLSSSTYNTSSESLVVSYTYLAGDSSGKTTNLVASVNIGGKILSYTYDADGNITGIKENNVLKESYEYDCLNRMTRENSVDNNKSILYTYDGGGNIKSKKIYPYTVGEVSGTPETITYTYGNQNWGDLLTAYNGETITYDAIGNPLNYRSGMQFQWDGGRKLTSFSTPNAVGSYVYNDSGIRVYKEVNGNKTEYYLNGTEIQTEITKFGGITRRVDYIYDENGSVYGFVVDNTSKYYYTKNLQGDIIGIVNSQGTQTLVEYSYDAWGKATISYPNTANLTETQKQARYLLGSNNPFRYRGYYFDNETGFYYLNSRYYDPEIGRFINADGLVSTGTGIVGFNMFAYCGNNPIVRRDISGERYEQFGGCGSGGFITLNGGLAGGNGLSINPDFIVRNMWSGGSTIAELTAATLIGFGIETLRRETIAIHQYNLAKSIEQAKTAEKDITIAPTLPKGGQTYYHVTTPDNAALIAVSETMFGSSFEGGYVYAWRMKPNKYAIKNSGAHMGVIISFKTNASFVKDTGIDDVKVQKYGPVVSTRPGPIAVWDVMIVG